MVFPKSFKSIDSGSKKKTLKMSMAAKKEKDKTDGPEQIQDKRGSERNRSSTSRSAT